MKDFNNLKKEYVRILSTLDVSFFDVNHQQYIKQLAGLFVTSEPDGYFSAKNKIMIVGAETMGWPVLKKGRQFESLDSYIELAVNRHKTFFAEQLNQKITKKITFHDFTRAIAKRSGKEGLIYSNLFCFAWNKGSPIQSPFFSQIKSVSQELLKAQIDYFEPEIIIFANGMTSIKYRREIFPLETCTDSKNYESEGISIKQLWEFKFDNKFLCYRIQHPSTISGRSLAAQARQKLIELLPEA